MSKTGLHKISWSTKISLVPEQNKVTTALLNRKLKYWDSLFLALFLFVSIICPLTYYFQLRLLGMLFQWIKPLKTVGMTPLELCIICTQRLVQLPAWAEVRLVGGRLLAHHSLPDLRAARVREHAGQGTSSRGQACCSLCGICGHKRYMDMAFLL